jgi:hypothetical protein
MIELNYFFLKKSDFLFGGKKTFYTKINRPERNLIRLKIKRQLNVKDRLIKCTFN